MERIKNKKTCKIDLTRRAYEKGTEFLPQTQIFSFQYLCNLMLQTFDISNLDYLI